MWEIVINVFWYFDKNNEFFVWGNMDLVMIMGLGNILFKMLKLVLIVNLIEFFEGGD